MSVDHPIAVSLTSAYLLGSIPFGYLLVRIIYGSDVRQSGSGNIGATNVSRTSPALGVVTLLLDALKGTAAVALVLLWVHGTRQLAFAAAFASICGHMFPVWLGFRGGKGVATGLGSFALLTPKAVLIAIAIFVAVVVAFRWVALGSVVASASLPPLAWALGEAHRTSGASGVLNRSQPLLWITCAAALIVLKHHGNIRRMLARSEPHFRALSK
ncbi:MAG TPA: glycerol-3-phosphate 1-O-acyltransferase PlsY [Terriglobales bacterium]|jgi:glycerol-3-phosphate acyltransferase PlsY|nr:glycerol-3-phosphate 1-O-acyltransferase PlsY [Terriglobales bacterium]